MSIAVHTVRPRFPALRRAWRVAAALGVRLRPLVRRMGAPSVAELNDHLLRDIGLERTPGASAGTTRRPPQRR